MRALFAAWMSIGSFFRPYAKMLAASAIVMLACSFIDVLIPLYQRYIIDSFIAIRSSDGLVGAAAVGVLIFSAQMAGTMAFTRIAIRIEMGVSRDLKCRCFDHLQTLSVSYYSEMPVGRLISTVFSDTDKIGLLVAWGLVDVIWGTSYIAFAVISMLMLDPLVGGSAALALPIMIATTVFFQRRIVETDRRVRRDNALVTAAFNECVGGARTTKMIRAEKVSREDFALLAGSLRDGLVRSAAISSVYMPLMGLVASICIAIIIYSGGSLIGADALDIGTLSAMVSYAVSMLQPIRQLSRLITEASSAQANIERVASLLATDPEVKDSPEVVARYGSIWEPKRDAFEPIKGDVELRHVSFRYGSGPLVIDDLCLSIPAGTRVAIVGETGAGKSTLVNLLCRFYEPTSGEILIDGRDIRSRSVSWLRSNIGFVLQDPHLFSGTVRENIACARRGASDEEVERALESVGASGVVRDLERGLDTDVGEGGSALSTGEKQLVSFARAVLADPRIFILDEATSSIDTRTEAMLVRAVAGAIGGRTSFVIAHRMSTIRDADLILVVSAGRIVEQGTHDELIALGGRYADLWRIQFDDDTTMIRSTK